MNKILLSLIVLMFCCTKQVITVLEPVHDTGNEIMMTFPLDEPVIYEPPAENKIKRCVIVYFKFDSDELQKSERWKILNIDKPVEIIGGCCPIGTDEYNYTLGIKRAVSVRSEFERMKVNVVSCTSIGERNLIETDKSKYWLNRRCEIRY